MGAEGSKSAKNGEHNQFSKSQVEMLLKHQKQMMDEKINELLQKQTSTQNVTVDKEAIKQEAKKEVEREMRQKYGQDAVHPQPAATPSTSANPTSSFPTTPVSPYPTTNPISPYPTTNPISLYPTTNPISPHPTTNPLPPYRNTTPVQLYPTPTPISSTSNTTSYPRTVTTFSYVQQPHLGQSNQNTSPATQNSLYPKIQTPPSKGIEASYVFVNKNIPSVPAGRREKSASRPSPSAPPAPRNLSATRQSNREAASVVIPDEFKCPTCREIYTLTVFQCPRGHSSCLNCKNSGRICGVCFDPIGNMRNITLEAFIFEKKVNCSNASDGCSLLIKLGEMANHAKVCTFRIMPCPLTALFGKCSWSGKLSQMADHFNEVHQMHRQAEVDTEMHILRIQGNIHIVHFVIIGTFNFLFHLMVRGCNIYITVQILGTDNCASKWSYDIHLYNKREPRRKYQYIDSCHSINIPINDIVNENKCAVIPINYANTFMNEGKLTYKFYIKKDSVDNEGRNQRGRSRGRRR